MPQMADLRYTGLNLDAPDTAIGDHWSDARNVLMREVPERITGETAVLGTPLFPPLWLQQTRDASDNVIWVYCATSGIGTVAGTTHTDRTPVGGITTPGVAQPWTGGVLNSIPFVNNTDGAWYWDGTATFLDLPDWPATRSAQSLRAFKFHLIAMAINESGTLLEDSIYWSDAAAPGQIPQSWTPEPTNLAGSAELSETRGQVIDGAALRDVMLLYKESSAYAMSYVGGNQVMQIRLLSPTVGALGRNCIANLHQLQAVLTKGDVVLTDGQQFRSIADGAIRRSLFANANAETLRNAFVVADEAQGEIVVAVPQVGETYARLAYVYDLARERWGVRELALETAHMAYGAFQFVTPGQGWDSLPYATWEDWTGQWGTGQAGQFDFDRVVAAVPSTPAFHALDLDASNNVALVESRLTRRGIQLPGGEIHTVRRAWLKARGTQGQTLQCTVRGYPDQASSAIGAQASTGAGTFRIGQQVKVDLLATGRYFELEIAGSSADVNPWRLESVVLEYEPRGRF